MPAAHVIPPCPARPSGRHSYAGQNACQACGQPRLAMSHYHAIYQARALAKAKADGLCSRCMEALPPRHHGRTCRACRRKDFQNRNK